MIKDLKKKYPVCDLDANGMLLSSFSQMVICTEKLSTINANSFSNS